jgi:hypothetical protein
MLMYVCGPIAKQTLLYDHLFFSLDLCNGYYQPLSAHKENSSEGWVAPGLVSNTFKSSEWSQGWV